MLQVSQLSKVTTKYSLYLTQHYYYFLKGEKILSVLYKLLLVSTVKSEVYFHTILLHQKKLNL